MKKDYLLNNVLKAFFLSVIISCYQSPVLKASAGNQPGKMTKSIDLSGIWQFRLDPDNKGVEGRWWLINFDDTVQLPGSLQEQGFGFDLDADRD